MRYRRLQYRYAIAITSPRPQSPAPFWRFMGIEIVSAQPSWRPEADIYETAAAIVILVELAGVDEEALEVLLFEDALVVEGQRSLPGCEGGGVYHRVGIRQGVFRLEVPLATPIDPEGVDARYDRGILRIQLPKVTGGDYHGG